MITINIKNLVGDFAENKDKAKDIRLEKIVPAIKRKEEVVLDFSGVDGTTQSFIHALISDLLRKYGVEVLDIVSFKNCNDSVKKMILVVSDYMQEAE